MHEGPLVKSLAEGYALLAGYGAKNFEKFKNLDQPLKSILAASTIKGTLIFEKIGHFN